MNVLVPQFYQNGKDVQESVAEYQRLSLWGCHEATYNLANCYLFGQGVEINKTKAICLLDELAAYGDVHALNNLGVCYNMGIGVEKNVDIAMDLFTIAADKGHARSQYNLGIIYLALNAYEFGMAYIILAAFNGHASAQMYLDKLHIDYI